MAAVRQISLCLSHVFALRILIGNFEDQDWVVGNELGIYQFAVLTLKNSQAYARHNSWYSTCHQLLCEHVRAIWWYRFRGTIRDLTNHQSGLKDVTLAQPSYKVSTWHTNTHTHTQWNAQSDYEMLRGKRSRPLRAAWCSSVFGIEVCLWFWPEEGGVQCVRGWGH